MVTYAFWNNKGGVGKSFLCFVAATEHAHNHPERDVYVIDLCPQGNVSETLLGGHRKSEAALVTLLDSKPRRSIAGYLEARLNDPFRMLQDSEPFVCCPHDHNRAIPANLFLVCGDNMVEILAEAIRQTSQLTVPFESWTKVMLWVKELTGQLQQRSGDRDAVVFVDCNPSFSTYTQLALVAADNVIVPFTADDSSRRGIINMVALLYGFGDPSLTTYAKISFAQRATESGLATPRLHSFVSNRVTMYRGQPSSAFEAAIGNIKQTLNDLHKAHRSIFAQPQQTPGKALLSIPDYHSACVVTSLTGRPLHTVKPGPHVVSGERIQLNQAPLESYKKALRALTERL